ncbi:MAG: sigma-70 family RNA polymerase sigma factor [Isosphaeraceae bacterium]
MPARLPVAAACDSSECDEHESESRQLAQIQSFLQSLRGGQPATAGASETWGKFYLNYDDRIRDVLWRMGLREPDLGDAVQDVWKDLVIRLPMFRHDPQRCRLSTWVKSVAHNRGVDAIRRRRRNAHVVLDDVLAADVVDETPGPNDPARDDAEQLRQALDALEARVGGVTCEILRLRGLQERSVDETAALLGMTAEQVWSRYHRAKKALRSEIERCRESDGRLSDRRRIGADSVDNFLQSCVRGTHEPNE